MTKKKIAPAEKVHSFPELFLTQNARKFIKKQLKELEVALERESSVFATEKEKNESNTIMILRSKIRSCEAKLLLPTYSVTEQSRALAPGNGAIIFLNEERRCIVIDGVCVCKHKLPKNHHIIEANSPMGKAVIGKKVGQSGTYLNGDLKEHNFVVEKILSPSEAKPIFKGKAIVNL